MKLPPAVSYQYAASALRPAMRIAERSLRETPTTREFTFPNFRTSPSVKLNAFTGDALRPSPPNDRWNGSSTTLMSFLRYGSHQSLATMPEWLGCRPDSRTE